MKQVEERKQEILQRLNQENRVYVAELSKEFEISEVTIRKDLKELEERGALKRIHGGAAKLDKASIESTLDVLEQIHVREKKAIAREAYKLVTDNDAILLDASTTTRELAHLIRDGGKKLMVITTALQIALELAPCPNIEVIQIGGLIRPSLFTVMGPLATSALRDMHADKAFIGVNGIDITAGLTTQNMFECEIKRTIVESASQSFVLADASKINCVTMGVICPVNRVNGIITDSSVSPEALQELESSGVDITVA